MIYNTSFILPPLLLRDINGLLPDLKSYTLVCSVFSLRPVLNAVTSNTQENGESQIQIFHRCLKSCYSEFDNLIFPFHIFDKYQGKYE